MKLKKILYLFFIFATFISITNIANATEKFNIISVTLDSPVEPGETPAYTIDLEFKNDNGDSLFYDDIKIEWAAVNSTTSSKFEEGNIYEFDLTQDGYNRVSADLNGNLSDDYYVIFNGERILEGDSLQFVPGAYKEASWTIPELVEGQPLPKEATVKFSNPLVSRKIEFTVSIKWFDENFSECNGNAEIGKKYTWGLGDLNYLNVIKGGTREEYINNSRFRDFRTKLYINGALSQNGSLGEFSVVTSNTITFDANGGTYSDNTAQKTFEFEEDATSIPVVDNPIRDGYIFSGYVDENGKSFDKYTNGEAKFNDGMKFKAEWIKLVDNKVIDFTKPIEISQYEWALLDILVRNKVIKITQDYIADDSGKILVTQTTDGKAVSVDNLTVSDNISYIFTENDFNLALTYNNSDSVGKITEIPRNIELVFVSSQANVNSGTVIQQPEPQPAQPVQNQTTQTNNPKTGDTITLWIGVLVISLSGLVLIKKKK